MTRFGLWFVLFLVQFIRPAVMFFIRQSHPHLVKSFSRALTRKFAVNHRLESNHLSLDINLLAQQLEVVKSHLEDRLVSKELIREVERIPELRNKRNSLIIEGDQARNSRKKLSKEIGGLFAKGKKEEAEKLKLEVEKANQNAQRADTELIEVEKEIEDILLVVPNLLDDRVPVGKDDTENPVVFSWREDNRKIGSEYKWHDDLARGLGGIDNDAAAKLSGTRFSVLVGQVARLERALGQYFLDFHLDRGYTEVSVPFIVSRSTLRGTGQLPKFEEDLFKVNHNVAGEDAFLIPTAEVPVTNIFRDRLLNYTQLPLHLVCYSPAFRAEAGSHGKDTRGLLRQHQFMKVELVKICDPKTSQAEHEKLVQDAEDLLQSLELPYRKVLLCSGDTGFAARICYDLEVWLPGQQAYREISSCSNCYDFQSRRMKLRYRDEETKKTVYPHTLNGSGVAVGRALIAILENYQEPDGSITIPEKLQPYMKGLTKLSPSVDPAFPYK